MTDIILAMQAKTHFRQKDESLSGDLPFSTPPTTMLSLNRRHFLAGTSSLVLFAPFLPKLAEADGVEELSAYGAAAPVMLALLDAFVPNLSFRKERAYLAAQRNLNTFFETESEEIQDRLMLGLRILQYRPLFSVHFSKFSDLNTSIRREYLHSAFATSSVKPMRTLYSSLKNLILMSYFDHPDVWSQMGYDGPLIKVGDDDVIVGEPK